MAAGFAEDRAIVGSGLARADPVGARVSGSGVSNFCRLAEVSERASMQQHFDQGYSAATLVAPSVSNSAIDWNSVRYSWRWWASQRVTLWFDNSLRIYPRATVK